jgi:hypothetical protein
MTHRLVATIAALAVVGSVQPLAATTAGRVPGHTKREAEVNVLRAIPRKWKARPLPGLVDPRTHLLIDNTEAVCRGRGKRLAGQRYSRFVCVIRPHLHKRREGLYVSYRALPGGRFTIRWLAYRRR